MKKVATILSLIIFCNSFFYYSYFSFSILKAKIEAVVAISNLDGHTKLIKVSTKELQKDESDEVWYNNKLYDVAKRESASGTEYVYLMRDEDEQDILNDNSDYFKNDSGFYLGDGYRPSLQKKSPCTTDYKYVIEATKKLLSYSRSSTFLSANDKYCFCSVNADVPTPPPRF